MDNQNMYNQMPHPQFPPPKMRRGNPGTSVAISLTFALSIILFIVSVSIPHVPIGLVIASALLVAWHIICIVFKFRCLGLAIAGLVISAVVMIICAGRQGEPSEPQPTNPPVQSATEPSISTASPAESPSEISPPEPIQEIVLGETLVTEKAEITFNLIEFSFDVLPDDTSSFYTHYEADSGEVYVHVDADIKNTQKQNLPCDEILDMEVDYDDGYMYRGWTVPEDSDGGFTYSNITSLDPLETRGIRFLADCPEEVESSGKAVRVILTIDGKEYTYNLRQ